MGGSCQEALPTVSLGKQWLFLPGLLFLVPTSPGSAFFLLHTSLETFHVVPPVSHSHAENFKSPTYT